MFYYICDWRLLTAVLYVLMKEHSAFSVYSNYDVLCLAHATAVLRMKGALL